MQPDESLGQGEYPQSYNDWLSVVAPIQGYPPST